MNYENRSGGSSKFKESTSRKGLEGKANKAVVVSLAKFLKVKKSEIILIKGEKSKNKVFDFFKSLIMIKKGLAKLQIFGLVLLQP